MSDSRPHAGPHRLRVHVQRRDAAGLGDIVNVADIQFQRPEIGIIYDMNGPEADKTRQDLIERVAKDRVVVAGTHLPFPGIGRLRKDQSGYAWMPASYLGAP